MVKILSLFVIFLLGASICSAQKHENLIKDTSFCKLQPDIMLINGSKTQDISFETLRFISTNNIAGLEILKGDSVEKKYHRIAPNGLMVVRLGKPIELLTLQHVLNKFNLSKNAIKMPVYIDSARVCSTAKLYIVLPQLKYIRIEKETGTALSYLSLRSNHKIMRPKPGEIYIKGINLNAGN